ncbi:alkaline phosphatase family protein [Galbitalea soli]|uniref:alkaline phosphatase family protein n=1 Tax=Galbitalea soli TaxID=1268042 RepID=UPI00184161D0|nr:hypothetical protein [Galbitalea soli]
MLPGLLSAVTGEPNRLALPTASKGVVVLVDGLGTAALKARLGHARTLGAALAAGGASIQSGFPTTTAAALATLTTGTPPGQHGLVGYSVLDADNDRVVNQLTGWDDRLDPLTWQREATVFERARAAGLRATAIGPERYRDSGFTTAVLRGADYVAGARIADRVSAALDWLASPGDGILYLYVPELDVAAHASGWQSPQWTTRLEEFDGALRTLVAGVPRDAGVLVTADHGVVDVPASGHLIIEAGSDLLDGVRFIAGEPRCLQLHVEQTLSAADRDALVQRWRDSESSRAWVATRAEAIDAGWFGSVDPAVLPRIGDVIVAARKAVAYYDESPLAQRGRSMVGQHGSWSTEEARVPLLRFGAFAS